MPDPEREQAIIAEFRKRSRRQKLVAFTALAVLAAVYLAAALEPPEWGVFGALRIPLLVVGLVGVVIFRFVNWRCPSCDSCLGRRWKGSFCSHCGARLR